MPIDPINESIIPDQPGVAYSGEIFGPPRHCPECGRELLKPRARFKRRLLWWVVALPFYIGALGALFQYVDFLPAGLQHPDRIKGFLFFILGAIPVGILTFRFKNSSRIFPYECFECPWKKDFPIQENRSFDLPENHSRF